jgi:hypothetical protein
VPAGVNAITLDGVTIPGPMKLDHDFRLKVV